MNPYEANAQFGSQMPMMDPAAAPGPQGAPPPLAPQPQGGIPGLNPAVLQQLIAMGALDDKGSALDEQMALANALRQGTGQKHSTGLGGAFGAIGDTLNTYHAKQMMDEVKAGRGQLSTERTAGRGEYARLLGLLGQQPAPGTGGEF